MSDENNIDFLFNKLTIRNPPLSPPTTPPRPQNSDLVAPPPCEPRRMFLAPQQPLLYVPPMIPNFGMQYELRPNVPRSMPRNIQFGLRVAWEDPYLNMFLNPNHDPSEPRPPTPSPQLPFSNSNTLENGIKYMPLPRKGSREASRLSENVTKGYSPYLVSRPNSAMIRRRRDDKNLIREQNGIPSAPYKLTKIKTAFLKARNQQLKENKTNERNAK